MSTLTILCVDDEHNVLSTLRTQLMRHFSDYTIEVAESATEALQLVEELLARGAVIPLVIADQIMPGVKGDELLIELHVRHPEILKVMLTGQARAEDVGNAVNHAGLYRFITKPWTEVDLILTVTEAVRRYQQEQQLRQQQLALEQANRELIQSEQDLRTIFNNVYDAILIHDLDGIILDANDRALEVRGATRSQLIGASIADLSAPDAPLERLPEMLERVRAGETLRLEWRERRFSDQCLFDVELSLRQATLNNRSVLISGMRDISDRKRVEIALQQLNQDLERRVQERTIELQKATQVAEAASQAKGKFLANMSHELRTPLNAILGFAQLMVRDYKLEHEQRQQLNVINRNGEHLLRLINDILEMSKIEAGYMTFTPTCFNLYSLLNSLKEVFQLRATEKKLEFIIKTSPELPHYVKTDESKLRQILINLVGNAIKFTSRGCITLQVSVVEQSALPQTGELERDRQTETALLQSPDCIFLSFNVEDTGLGIDPNELENLFEPFIQSKHQPLPREGTGLGLTISRQFVQLMGGNLTVQSVPDVGSMFSFVIPVQLSEAVNLRLPSLSSSIRGLAPNQPAFRILVTDDHEANRQLLVQLLQAVGFEVQSAINGQEAIAIWETWQPHLIWMDMRMPQMDGYEATRWIRAQEYQRQSNLSSSALSASGSPSPHSTTIIAITANAFEDERNKVLSAGCDDFVRKPFQEKELLEKLETYLGVHYLYSEVDETNHRTKIPFDAIAVLQELSPTLLNRLYQATVRLNQEELTPLIQQVALVHAPLATLMTEQLNNFEFEKILQLLQKVVKPFPSA